MIYKFDSWKPMTADTQSQIDAIFNQVVQYNQQYDTSKPLFFDTETTVRFRVCSPCAACCSGAMAWMAAHIEG